MGDLLPAIPSFNPHMKTISFARRGNAAGLAAATFAAAASSLYGSADYGPAIWNPNCGQYYTSGNGHRFHVVHDIEGYYLSTISYFKNCSTQVSIHYCVNGKQDTSSDAPAGEITQIVAEANYAWHVGCWNRYSTGTEHEGFASNPAWYTDAMYSASAALTRHIADKFAYAKDRNHIVGHNEWQNAGWRTWASANLGIDPSCNTHTDPGPYWDWNKYMGMVLGKKVKYDFNGDGRADVVCFHRGSAGDTAQGYVWVAPSNGGSAFGPSAVWSTWFCVGSEIPVVGDFNGDGRSDVATFVRGNGTVTSSAGDVFVALSTGGSFGGGAKWNDWLGIGDEIPLAGDFNGDGKDDIAIVHRGASGDSAQGNVWVGLSSGSSFGGGALWNSWFCVNNEIPLVGDFNGDGKADLVTFHRGGSGDPAQGKVWVALSTGSAFGAGQQWHSWFCVNDEVPMVGDANGDGKDDIITFHRGASGDPAQGYVWVALSTGTSFGASQQWSSWFCVGTELPGVADFGGDGRSDVATFLRGAGTTTSPAGDVYVEFSGGSSFVPPAPKWNDWFGTGTEVVQPAPSPALWP